MKQNYLKKMKEDLRKDNVHFKPYNDIYEDVKTFTYSDVVMVDHELLNNAIYNNIPKEVNLVEKKKSNSANESYEK